MHRENIRFIIQKEAAYPNRLRKIYDTPYDFSKGQPYEEKNFQLAIVGSRYPTTWILKSQKSSQKSWLNQGVQIIEVDSQRGGVDRTVHRGKIIDKKTDRLCYRVLDVGSISFTKKIFSYFATCAIRQLFPSTRQAVNRSNGIFQKGTESSVD